MKMTRLHVIVMLVFVASGSASLATAASAQYGTSMRDVATTVSTLAPQNANGTENPLGKSLSINLRDVPLHVALDEIMKRSGVEIAYSKAVVPLERRVSVRGEGITLGAALLQALHGTSVEARLAAEGRVVLGRARNEQKATQGIVAGRVLNEKTKQPIVGATVSLDQTGKGVMSGEDGSFRLSLPAGEHTIHVRGVGYLRQSRKITVSEGETVTITITLEPNASVLDEVIVTGTVVETERKQIPNPITVITAEEIERRGITRIEQFFRGEVPGVIALDEGSQVYDEGNIAGTSVAKVYVRGASNLNGGANPLKTYIDGVEILDPSYLGTIDMNSVDRIEIIAGPQAATIYGSGAMGGVMQIFTKKGTGHSTPDMTLRLQYGMLETNLSNGRTPTHNHTLSVSGGNGPQFSYSGNLSYGYSGQWQPNLFRQTYGGSIGATHRQGPISVNGSVSATGARNGTTTGGGGSLAYFTRRSNGDWEVGNQPPAMYLSQRVSTGSSQTVSLNADYRAHEYWQHHLTVGKSQTNFAVVPEAPQLGRPQDTLFNTNSATGQRTTASYNTTLLPPAYGFIATTLTLGWNQSIGDQTSVRGCLANKTATSLINCGGIGVQVGKSIDSRSWGGFGSWRIGFFDQLFVTLGLRAERNPTYGQDHKIDWTPTNGATYTLTIRDFTVKLLGSYGRATRPPSSDARDDRMTFNPNYAPSMYLAQLANPELRPERSRGPQGGVELYYGNWGSLSINRYRQVIADLIQNVKADSLQVVQTFNNLEIWIAQNQNQNTATIRQQGWESTGSLNVGPLTLRGTYSWTDSRVLEVNPNAVGVSYYRGMSFVGLPSHTGNFIVGYAHGPTSITVSNNYIGQSLQGYTGNMLYRTTIQSRIKTYLERKITPPTIQWVKPAYLKSNVSASQRVNGAISATLNITNVGNSYGSDVTAMDPTLGRQTFIGLAWRMGGGR